ncbi:hypothetical protein RGQ29_032466 [Quercus rubra]|uniref:Uncharacterized protein n=1 Tax=Quercus rubra TaxID=3512 RepID=A0AAN7DVN1_QUERU|nr:hypothetical protein RGQ29_032466 [Quercus rubra]
MTQLVCSLAAKAIEDLGVFGYQRISLARGVESDMDKLRRIMSKIIAVLLDAEEGQVKSQSLQVWLRQVKDVCYAAINVMDEFECEARRRRVVKTHGSFGKKVKRFFSYSNPLVFALIMGDKIKEILQRVEELEKDSYPFCLEERCDKANVHRERETHSFIPASDVVGRDDDKQKIIDLLMLSEPGDVDNVSVISILGLGGVGKTALVQCSYNDERVATHFGSTFWVDMSEGFNLSKLAKEILNPVPQEGMAFISVEELSKNQVQIVVQKALKGKRFFIVFDNVCNCSLAKWNDVRGLLIGGGGARGSKIVVTTRYQNVASMMSTGHVYALESLSEDDSWLLFKRWAFNKGEENQYLRLVEIGKEILKKCKGVPLAVTNLGSLLCSNRDERFWSSIRDSDIWELEQEDDFILPILKMSYDHLPSHLKPCIAYLALFPKDYNFNSTELIRSFMANGLLRRKLSARSFFHEVKDIGFSFTFKMHDLLHELSYYIAKDDYCLIGNNDSRDDFKTVRHVSILYDNSGAGDKVELFLHKLSNGVQSIIFLNKGRDAINVTKSFIQTCISRFKYLRLLDLSPLSFKALPSSICDLKHLRYLSLHGNTQLKKLPNSICDLQNLETLSLAGCKELEKLPRDMGKMISLRYLSITTKQICLSDSGIECLYSLQTLIFSECPKLESLPKGIKHLTALRNLDFESCGSLMSLPQGMRQMVTLESVKIIDCEKLDLMNGTDYPLRLRSLVIGKLSQLVALPQWFAEFANTLQFFHFYHCLNLEVLPDWLPDFSSLRKLQIWSCSKLSSLPLGIPRLTALRELEIRECPELSRHCERDVGKYWGEIAHIPLVHIV